MRLRPKWVYIKDSGILKEATNDMMPRPSMQGQINFSETCMCGEHKSTLKQWCDSCWDKVPMRVARNYKIRCDELARQIVKCNQHIRSASSDSSKPLIEVLTKDGEQ